MPNLKVEDVKLAANGRWVDILMSVCGLPADLLDGHKHPCPKYCYPENGGTDRFRFIDKEAGAAYCNRCFSSKNGDGFAAIMWYTGCTFPESIQKVADYLGIKPKGRSKGPVDPAKDLKFCDWNDSLIALWCMKKQPIKPDALKKAGARIATYKSGRNTFKVIAIPIWAEDPKKITGWAIYNITGGTLPKKSADGFEQVKVKTTFGSKTGLIGSIADNATMVIKTEGPSDMLALLSLDLPPHVSVVCNACGAKENPATKFRWLPDAIGARGTVIIHDCDEPGQDGATYIRQHDETKRPGWAAYIAGHEKSTGVTKNVVLPYSIEPTKGKDLRDWIAEGHTFADLKKLIEETEPFELSAEPTNDLDEAEDDPHRLARVNLAQYDTDHGGKLVFWRDEWWKYKDGRYRKIEIGELKAKVTQSIRKEFERVWREKRGDEPVKKVTRSLVANVIGAMESMVSVSSNLQMPCSLRTRAKLNYLPFSNGILDMDAVFADKKLDECLLEHTPDWFTSFCLNYEFNPEAECPKWLDYLEYTLDGDHQRIRLLQEWAGYLLTSSNDYQKFLVLEGEGKNGKTVFFAAMTAMLGEDNVSHVAMENFGGRFDLGITIGKAANICGDVGEIDHLAEGVLKQFTGGDTMQFDRKNLQPVQARPTAKLMCAWNTRPRIKDRSEGLWRRILLIPFNRHIEESRRVFGMDKPSFWLENGEAPGILLWAIAGLHRLKQQREFTKSEASQEVMEEYKIDSNPASEFFSDYVGVQAEGMIKRQKLFDMYSHWCRQTNCRPLGRRSFGKEVMSYFPGVDRAQRQFNGSREWYYIGISFLVDEIYGEKIFDGNLFS